MTADDKEDVSRLERYRIVKRVLQFSLPISLAVAIFFTLAHNRKAPERTPFSEQGRSVRTLKVALSSVIPTAKGYGLVTAQKEWQMVAQVSGRVLEMSELMKVGSIIPEGTRLLRIDPTDYALAESRQLAGVESVRAQIAQLSAQEKSQEASLLIESRSLELVRRDLERTRELFGTGNVSQTELDAAERSLLSQQKAVQSIKNKLSEIPANRMVLYAQIKESKAGLKGARLDIDRTELVAPFDLRIRSLSTQDREVVSANQVLAEADGIDAIEIAAQLPVGALRPLIPFNPAARDQPLTADRMSRLPELLGMTAVVRVKEGGRLETRKAQISRFTSVDPTTRTMGVVVEVRNPFKVVEDGEAPLVTGMYVEVLFRGTARSGCIAVPRSAVHEAHVFVSSADHRLEKRSITTELRQAEFVCIKSGLKEGDEIILTNLSPAIEGMLLDPRLDEDAARRLAAIIGGEDEGQ